MIMMVMIMIYSYDVDVDVHGGNSDDDQQGSSVTSLAGKIDVQRALWGKKPPSLGKSVSSE